MTAQPEALVVVPTYNERQNISGIVSGIRALGFEVLIVDDSSPDGTGEMAEEIASTDPGVRVLHRAEKAGLGAAYAEAFRVALEWREAGVICQMDADFSHDPADLPRLVRAVTEGADVAVGSRYVPGGGSPDWPWYRKSISLGGNLYARWALGLPIRDATGGFRAFRAGALARLDPSSAEASGYAFQVEMILRAASHDLSIVEVPITFRDRSWGSSKMGWRIVAEAMWLVTVWGIRRVTRR